jgi:uncharacterized PurR-regulated membrane protein YhhQ (DUF165 family)
MPRRRYAAMQRNYRCLDLLTALFVTVLLASNVASSAKIVDWGAAVFGLDLVFDAGTVLFPVSYIFCDVLTEVYGFRRGRRVIWMGFGAMGVFGVTMWLVARLPGATEWQWFVADRLAAAGGAAPDARTAGDAAYAAILGGVSSGAILIASLLGYFGGEFSNSAILARMKVMTRGRLLWTRTIGSTLVGQAVDTTVFVGIASVLGVFPPAAAVGMVVANYLFKVGVEVLFTPVTYAVVGALKRAEGSDVYDVETRLTPFGFTL